MTIPVSGPISFATINTEVGAAAGTPRSMDWLRNNTAYAYKDFTSIRGLVYFQAVSSQNSISRTAGGMTSNCANNCHSYSGECNYWGNWDYPNYANAIAASNCNQCSYGHGSYIQANCNCNCNCYVCNCSSSNCNCANCSDGCG